MDLTKLLSTIQVVAAIQYGNREATAADIDVLIISDDFSVMFFSKRIRLVESVLQAEKPIDPLCLTRQEWIAYKRTRPVFCKNILQGVFLYGDSLS